MTTDASTSTTKPVRAAIYLRISQDRELDGLAIERQREDCENLAKFRRWEVVETYIDQSKSATDKTKKRPAYDQMVVDYHAGMFSAIICWDLDRLTRQPRQLEDWIDWSIERGLQLVTANGDADLSKNGGRMFARVKAAVARSEVEQKSARQSSAHVQRAGLGKPPKGVRPLGYATDGATIRREAKAVQAIYAAFDGGASLRGIARALSGIKEADAAKAEQVQGVPKLTNHSWTLFVERNKKRAAEGLPPREVPKDKPWAADRPWAESTVLGILRNPRYAGYSVYTNVKDRRSTIRTNQEKKAELEAAKGEPVLMVNGKRKAWRDYIVRDKETGKPVMGQWEPLVSEDLWQRVQARLDDDKRVTNRVGTHRRHLGSGLFLCGLCDEPIRGASRGYRCKDGHINRTGTPIDDFVKVVIAERLRDPDALATVPATDSPRLSGLQAEIDEHRAKIVRAERDYDAGFLEAEDLKRNRDRANDAIARLEAEIKSLPRGRAQVPILAAADPAQHFLDVDLNTQRSTIEALASVRLWPQPRGRKGFDPASVSIEWS